MQNQMRRIFLVGAPRSGTTWLQLILAQNEEVVTCSETHLFTQYFDKIFERWEHELVRKKEGYKVSGLTQVLDEDGFLQLVREFVDGAFDRIAEGQDGATFFLEKTPEHLLHWERVLQVFPDALFVHIVRDPRSVANSFANASQTWWSWTQSGPVAVTRRWKANIEASRRLAANTDNYYEIKYESLSTDGVESLFNLLSWLGLVVSRERCSEMLRACHIDNLRAGAGGVKEPWNLSDEPDDFFRKGQTDSWETEMRKRDVALVEATARDEMDQLGYQMSQKMTFMAFVHKAAHSVVRRCLHANDRIAQALRRRLKKVLFRL